MASRQHSAHPGNQPRCKKEELGLAMLDAVTKSMITKALDSIHFAHHGFTVKYDDENNALATIRVSAYPEYRFVIHSNDNAFATSECPGIHSDAIEIFQRSDFELCIHALKKWAERVSDRWKDYVLDEFGGVGG